MPAAAIVAGSVISGAMSADAAGDAADEQAAGAAASNATQRYMYDTTRRDNKQFRETGLAANNRLAFLLGLGGASDERGLLTGQSLVEFTGGVPTYNSDLYEKNDAYRNAWNELAGLHYAGYGKNYTAGSDASWIERGLRSRLSDQFAKDAETSASLAEKSKQDPLYGSLLSNFSQSDLDNDVVYSTGLQFGLDEGRKGLERMAVAGGGLNSGAMLKALTRFGNDYGNTKANEAYNRFNTNKMNTYNMLAGLSGAGQAATNQVSAAGQNMANNVSQSQIGMGNARAASAIGQSNALGNAIGQGMNMWQQNKLMSQPATTTGGGYDYAQNGWWDVNSWGNA